MLIAAAVLTLAALMVIVSVRGLNRQCIREGCPTIFQTLMCDVRKDAKPLPRSLNDINEEQAEQYAREIVAFVVRFVSGDTVLTVLNHPRFALIRKQLHSIVEDAFLAANVNNPADATPVQQNEVTSLIMRDPRVSTELLKYCLNHPKTICCLRASLIDPKVFKRSVIRGNMSVVPSLAAMTWLRLTHRVLANAN